MNDKIHAFFPASLYSVSRDPVATHPTMREESNARYQELKTAESSPSLGLERVDVKSDKLEDTTRNAMKTADKASKQYVLQYW